MPSKWRMEVREIADARRTFKQIAQSADPATNATSLGGLYRVALGEVRQGLAKAGVAMRDQARRNAATMRVPKRLYAGSRPAIFAFSDFDAARDPKRQRAVLVGVRTGLSTLAPDKHLYVNWSPRVGLRQKDSTAIGKGGLSVSFGSLFEHGTKSGRLRPRWYFRNAYGQTKSQIYRMIGQAYIRAVKLINDAK